MTGKALGEAVTKGIITHARVTVRPGSGLKIDVEVPGRERVEEIVERLVSPVTGMYRVHVRIYNARTARGARGKKYLATGTFTALGKALMDAFFPGRGTEAVNKALLRLPLTSAEAFEGRPVDRVYDPRDRRWIPARPGMMCRTKDGMICAITDDPEGTAPPVAAEKDARMAAVLCDSLVDMLLAERPPTVGGGPR